MSSPKSTILPPLGSTLPFPNSSDVAILKYVGSVSGHDGVFCGLQLCGSISNKGKNNGSVNGISYFQVDIPNSGLFVPLRKVIGWLNSNGFDNQQNEFNNNNTNISSSTSSPIIKNNNSNKNNEEINELRRHINFLEKRLVQRENDMKELDIQLDELDATLRSNDARLARKEERFNRYRDDKEQEVNLLVSTIESLEKKVGDAEEKYITKIKELENNKLEINNNLQNDNNNNNILNEQIDNLKKELETQKEIYQNFKISKTKEINELRKFEMENFKINQELESLKQNTNDSIKLIEFENLNKEYIKTINDLKLDIELKDSKIIELENSLKSTLDENSILKLQINDLKQVKNSTQFDENGGLKAFIPTIEIDPAAGKDNFCTFCDREGHSTNDCPFEKDNIELF
ncbi:hypothetical protein C6P40_000200 [Pichia californica]|uniref:CAP-Gly domain-containing protein n=1 Tax=Pichia californica TaxID=460514 RepID=A0A9P7BH45_9ASCO|nr:hypothetical protein C6P42_000362 [[Candida] californica]KAG0689028.1 hypothetical protein C6P40_000200 [[Candida] californica]